MPAPGIARYCTPQRKKSLGEGLLPRLELNCYWTSIPLTRDLSFTVVNVIEYWLLLFAFTVNCLMTALFLAPAAAKISKLVSTGVPFMVTLKIRLPAVPQ